MSAQDQRLTDAEYELLCGVFAGRSTMPNELVPTVNAILAARCPGEGPTDNGLRAALERLTDWGVGRETSGVDRMIPASDLRAVLAEHAPTEGPVR